MRGPAVERAVMRQVALGEIARRENPLGDDALPQVGEAELFEAVEHDLTIGLRLKLRPWLGRIARGRVDEDEVIVVPGRRVVGLGERTHRDVDGRFARAFALAVDFVEFVRVMVREKNVVVGELVIAIAHAEKQDEAGGRKRRLQQRPLPPLRGEAGQERRARGQHVAVANEEVGLGPRAVLRDRLLAIPVDRRGVEAELDAVAPRQRVEHLADLAHAARDVPRAEFASTKGMMLKVAGVRKGDEPL